MSIHRPKHILSRVGLGVGTSKQMNYINETTAIGTETWNEMDEPWSEGFVIIAKPEYMWITKWEVGKPYIITKFIDDKRLLIAVYCDVTTPVKKVLDGFEFEDLYLDVWQEPQKSPVTLDEEELSEAAEAGYINNAEAARVKELALKIQDCLVTDKDFLDF